jgi:hypothetical protein
MTYRTVTARYLPEVGVVHCEPRDGGDAFGLDPEDERIDPMDLDALLAGDDVELRVRGVDFRIPLDPTAPRCPCCGAASEWIEMADGRKIAALCRDCADARPEDDGWGDAPRHGYDW